MRSVTIAVLICLVFAIEVAGQTLVSMRGRQLPADVHGRSGRHLHDRNSVAGAHSPTVRRCACGARWSDRVIAIESAQDLSYTTLCNRMQQVFLIRRSRAPLSRRASTSPRLSSSEIASGSPTYFTGMACVTVLRAPARLFLPGPTSMASHTVRCSSGHRLGVIHGEFDLPKWISLDGTVPDRAYELVDSVQTFEGSPKLVVVPPKRLPS
jgi:hypothetical protein